MRNRFSSLLLLSTLAVGVATTGCDTYSYPTPIPDKNEMRKNTNVYGDVDGPPNHSKNTYPADPDQATKSLSMKKKLYADDPDLYSRWNKGADAPVVGNPSPISDKRTAPTVDQATRTAQKGTKGVEGNTDAHSFSPGQTDPKKN